MKASETRGKAREFLKTLSGKYQLFIVSIVLAILTISVSYRQAIFTTSNGTEFSITESVPSIIAILSALFLASASYAVLDAMRLKRDHVEVGDNMIVFSNELFGKYVLTAIFFIGVTYAVVDDSAACLIIAIIGLITMIAGVVLAIIKTYSYAMTAYILYDDVQNDTYEGPRSVIRKSKELMNGNKWRFFCLQFSFIGWNILTGMTFGLLYFYTLPYIATADLFFYENLLENAE